MQTRKPILEKVKTCHNNPEKLFTLKIDKLGGYLIVMHCSFDIKKINMIFTDVKIL